MTAFATYVIAFLAVLTPCAGACLLIVAVCLGRNFHPD